MLSNCGTEDPWESLGQQGYQVLKKINPKYSSEGLMLKLKLWYFGHLMQRADSLEKTLMLGKVKERRRRGWQKMRWLGSSLSGHESEQTLGDSEGQGILSCCSPWGFKELDKIEQQHCPCYRNPWWFSGKKKSACKVGDSDLNPGWGRSSGEGNDNPLQYSCLGKSMDREAWQAIVHGS